MPLSYRSRSAHWSFYIIVLPGITTQSRIRLAIFRRLKSVLAERVIRLLYAETVTSAAGDCSFSLLVSNFDTFSRAQFFALVFSVRGVYIDAYRIFWFRGAKRLSRFKFARAPTTGLSTIYFFIIVVVYRAIAQRAELRFPRCLAYDQ